MKLTINIDGGSRGNPGPAAYGCYLQPAGQPPIELKGKLGITTNNVAEYHGLLRALEKARELGAEELLIRADSELMVRQMRGIYRVKNANILPLYQAAQALLPHFRKVEFHHVYREHNQDADRLCNEALDDPSLPIEPLGLRPSAPPPSQKPSEKKVGVFSQEEKAASPDRAKAKLVGTLLQLVALGGNKKYAVVVQGTSWKLELLALPRGMVPGDRVQVLGNLAVRGTSPVIQVTKIKKA